MKAKQRQLLIVLGLVVGSIVLGIAGVLLAVMPQRSHVSTLDNEIANEQAQLVALHGKPESPAVHAAQLFQLARAMPDDTDMPGIVVDLARASTFSGINLDSIAPGTPVIETDGANSLPLTVVVSGRWNQLAKFLHALRSDVRADGTHLRVNGRLFVVGAVQITTATTGAELTATLTVDAFSYAVPIAPAVDTTSTTTTTSTPPGSAQAAG